MRRSEGVVCVWWLFRVLLLRAKGKAWCGVVWCGVFRSGTGPRLLGCFSLVAGRALLRECMYRYEYNWK